MRRILVLTAAAGAVAMVGLSVGEAAVAAASASVSGPAPASASASAPASVKKLPKGFLLYEAKAAGPSKSWEHWKVSDSLKRRLEVNPCNADPGAEGRTSARTITYVAETDYLSEQVVIYRDQLAARAAFRSLNADLKKCERGGTGGDRYAYTWKKSPVGDEAFRIGGFFFESRLRYVVVRQGRALAIYARTGMVTKKLPSSQFRPLIIDAQNMAEKVCTLSDVCE